MKVSPAVETGVALRQEEYYNMNHRHDHLTCKVYGGKDHIATDWKYKDPNYYRNKRSKYPNNPKMKNRDNTNTHNSADNNQQQTQGNYE